MVTVAPDADKNIHITNFLLLGTSYHK
jgi:hypothetical protein